MPDRLTVILQLNCCGTFIQCRARLTRAAPSNIPNPYRKLTFNPTPFVIQLPSFGMDGLLEYTTIYWISLQVRLDLEIKPYKNYLSWYKIACVVYLTSKANANMPAANGAAAEVPVCRSVHP